MASPFGRMAAHASDLGNSLNRHHRGGKRNTMVMMFVGGVVLMLDDKMDATINLMG